MHTNALKTSAWILHNLSLAVAYGGPLYGRFALGPAIKEISSEQERGKVLETAWSKFVPINLAAHSAFTASWLVLRTMSKGRNLGKKTDKLLIAKDTLVAGALLTGLANIVATKKMEREFPEGVPVTSGEQPSPRATPKGARFHRFFNVMGPINLAFLAGAIAVGPVLAVSAFRGSRRKMLSHFLRR